MKYLCIFPLFTIFFGFYLGKGKEMIFSLQLDRIALNLLYIFDSLYLQAGLKGRGLGECL